MNDFQTRFNDSERVLKAFEFFFFIPLFYQEKVTYIELFWAARIREGFSELVLGPRSLGSDYPHRDFAL